MRTNTNLNTDLPFRDPAVPLSVAARELRRLVDKQVSSDEGSLDMNAWEVRERDLYGHSCGTTRCLAGWAQYLGDGRVGDDVAERAVALLELTLDEYLGEGHIPLFYQFSPDKARERMHKLAQA